MMVFVAWVLSIIVISLVGGLLVLLCAVCVYKVAEPYVRLAPAQVLAPVPEPEPEPEPVPWFVVSNPDGVPVIALKA